MAAGIFELTDPVFEDVLRLLLETEVEGRGHLEALAVDPFLPEHLLQLRLNVGQHPVRRLDGEAVRRDVQRLLRRDPAFGLRDEPFVLHEKQNLVASSHRALGVLERTVAARAGGNAGEERRFAECEFAGLLAEIALGRGFNAVVNAAVGDLVQVPLQDLVLGVAICQLDGVDGLLQLADDGARSPL